MERSKNGPIKTFSGGLHSQRLPTRRLTWRRLSLPRGNGKSWLAAHLAARVLDPGDDLFRPGTESVVIAPSLNQGRIVYRFARDMLGDDADYRFADSFTLCQITHKPTRTVLQVRSSSAKGALGLVNTPWVIL